MDTTYTPSAEKNMPRTLEGVKHAIKFKAEEILAFIGLKTGGDSTKYVRLASDPKFYEHQEEFRELQHELWLFTERDEEVRRLAMSIPLLPLSVINVDGLVK